MLNMLRRRRHPQPHPQLRAVAVGSLAERPDLRIGNLLDDPRLRLAVFGDDSRHDETAA